MLEALEVIEIPPEPPEQAGRALYERLEIGGMRNQLMRRAIDLKKNISGCHRFLDVLREMSSVVSESKMLMLNESLDLNTNRLCLLQDANERTSGALINLQNIFGGILAFDILDRLTGNNWSLSTSWWFSSFYQQIQDTPMLWFLISMFIWLITGLCIYQTYKSNHYIKQGLTTVRLKVNRKIFVDKLNTYLRATLNSTEERQYDDFNEIVKTTYTDNLKRDWGGAKPTITFEFDERNSFLLSVTVKYNRREAKKSLVFTAEELREKIMRELNDVDVWDVKGEDRSHEDLASDKRANIQKLLDLEDEDEEAAAAGAH
jgi:WD repeat-containing protein 35